MQNVFSAMYRDFIVDRTCEVAQNVHSSAGYKEGDAESQSIRAKILDKFSENRDEVRRLLDDLYLAQSKMWTAEVIAAYVLGMKDGKELEEIQENLDAVLT